MNKKFKLPKTVYKYRSWDDKFHKKVLKENQLYMAALRQFNDPFDGRIPTKFELLNTDEKKWQYAFKMCEGRESIFNKNGLTIESESKRIFNELKNSMNLIQGSYSEIEWERNNKYYGVLSLSKRWNSILMWSHYADSHKGYCIGFNGELLQKFNHLSRGGFVNYTDDYPEISPLDDDVYRIWEQWNNKAKEWEYEEEYRIIWGLEKPMENSERILRFPDSFVNEVIIGISASEKTEKEILDICYRKGFPVYKAKAEKFKFNLIKERIH